MRVLTAYVLVLLLILSSGPSNSARETPPNSPFDQYGTLLWEDEKARLDNFAIQLLNVGQKWVGYILVYDEAGGCPGEASARAMRAKRYLVKHRGVPWSRVIWRHDGYQREMYTTLLIVPSRIALPFPFRDPVAVQVDRAAPRDCSAKLKKIQRSRW